MEILERKTMGVSLAVRLIDDLNSRIVQDGIVQLSGNQQRAIEKSDGFYVFSDVPDGSHEMIIQAPNYQRHKQVIDLPLPAIDRLVLNVPGENELMLVVQTSTPDSITFQPINIHTPIPAGTKVISNKSTTYLNAELEGEAIGVAELNNPGTAPDNLVAGDVVRIILERVVRMKPGPYFSFEHQLQRLIGMVRDSATGHPLIGADVEIIHLNTMAVQSEDVGQDASDTVSVKTIGADATTNLNKRVVGTDKDLTSITNNRGRFNFYFPERLDLPINSVTVVAKAAGYIASDPQLIDLTVQPATYFSISLMNA